MSLLQEWRDHAYSHDMQNRAGQLFWANYFNVEKEFYIKLLSNPDKVWEGSVASLAKEFDVDVRTFVGFLDGINDSLITPNPVEDMDQDTKVSLAFDKEKLYYNMVANKAEWLYELEQWDDLLSEERRKELYREQKSSSTVVKGKKVGRNDPCPCGSGKKYKKCCGVNA
ncbi:SEC-C domain-containing protein [Mobilitalea sibirica]|uniref:SEC-C domain-containing protein n=1 Tax=Mobilitalea sibirica TaxID=1462919 RepID=A0A8J7HAS0_9FIRM|nr:SEC-C metal-binding domain-containing protein [Mobilitalea sibirica]MBH1941600.1 SEC-C domain-containing protein [Mobilitalea sibirica]